MIFNNDFFLRFHLENLVGMDKHSVIVVDITNVWEVSAKVSVACL